MDPETALGLVRHGTTLLLLDVPQFTLIGIDTQMFSAGPACKGIKMIPPSPHFIYYSPSNRGGNEFSPIIGFFIDASPSKVIALKWNQEEKRLVKLSEEEGLDFGALSLKEVRILVLSNIGKLDFTKLSRAFYPAIYDFLRTPKYNPTNLSGLFFQQVEFSSSSLLQYYLDCGSMRFVE